MSTRGRPRKFDRTKTLRNAMMTFWQQGYDNTSMADLVAAMGINTPSIYSTFGSKEALFNEVITLYRTSEGSKIWQETMRESSAEAAIKTLLTLSAEEFTQANKPKGCLIILGAMNPDDTNLPIHHLLQECRAESKENLISLLKRDIENGRLKSEIDCLAIATYYITLQQGMSIQARDGASKETLLSVAEIGLIAWPLLIK
ncbi:TetR/AcrR family transcriptional regulator [Thalassotalea sediminis]|uniref:TetR/AcrR family transcriptional regulator n=1 Tax=Thalassotalea sediminis TaxID=1759089 RepID=UPI002572CA70|nr:TetR/AcrR family transcriptional regulator [Thalassotalea sediminis]